VFLAVIPAAGLSTRMGQPKLALPFAGRTVLEHVILALREGGVRHVVAVTGPHVPELNRLAKAAGAEVHGILEGTPDMRTTVEHGLRWLQERQSPQAADAFLLAPADHPAFSADLVRQLCQAYLASPSSSIVLPVLSGHRGHPALIAWRHAPAIQAMPRDSGINSYLREHPAEILELETAERGILLNLDRPEDYVALQSYENSYSVQSASHHAISR
jgi:molybdenum cofactor cytidylyltransferase